MAIFNSSEFCDEQIGELCKQMNINYRKISIESHSINETKERIIQTVRESILKKKFEV